MLKQQPVGADLMSPQSLGQALDAPVEPLVVIGIPLVKFDESLHLIIFFRSTFQCAQVFEVSSLTREVFQQQLER
mgnify:CR=1 FL=1